MITRTFLYLDDRLLRPASPQLFFVIRTALAAVMGLRLATRDWVKIAERPEELTANLTVMSFLPADAVTPALVTTVHLAGLIGAGMVLARWRPHTGFVLAWVAYLVLTALWGSSGKVMHNDVLTVLVGFVFLFTAPPSRNGPTDSHAQWGWPPRAALALIGVVYFFTGFQKLRVSGLEWVFSDNMQWVLLQGVSPFGPWLTELVAKQLWLTQALAGGALSLEILALVLLFFRWARGLFVLSVAIMHTSIWVFLGLDYSAWVLTVAAVAVPSCLPVRRWLTSVADRQRRVIFEQFRPKMQHYVYQADQDRYLDQGANRSS